MNESTRTGSLLVRVLKASDRPETLTSLAFVLNGWGFNESQSVSARTVRSPCPRAGRGHRVRARQYDINHQRAGRRQLWRRAAGGDGHRQAPGHEQPELDDHQRRGGVHAPEPAAGHL